MDLMHHIHFSAKELPARAARGRSASVRKEGPRHGPDASCLMETACDVPVDSFIAWLFSKANLDATRYRPRALGRRLPACLRRLAARSTEQAREILENKPELLPAAISTILIGVSEFFRDPPVFEHLRKATLPEMLRTRQGLRVYSAGCSEGHELYSMAMLLDELGKLEGSELLGVDCRPDAIEAAQSGLFDRTDLSSTASLWRDKYFLEPKSRLAVVPHLRRRLQWSVCDVLACGESPMWDVILFRNVAIYLDRTEPVWKHLVGQLVPGGVLITGKAERPPRGLPLVREFMCIYRKTGV